DVRDVLQQVRARHQRQRDREHFLRVHRRRAECDVDGEHDRHDARDQHRVAEQVETLAIFDHAYCTLRSTKRNWITVSPTTMIISTTDCAPELPMSSPWKPSVKIL